MNTKCEIIRDLLPLYVEGVVSEASRQLIEEHLAECADCREYLKLLQEDLPEAEAAAFADETASLRKIKRKIAINRILIVMVTLGFAIAAIAFMSALKLTDYEGTLGENVSYELPDGYEEIAVSAADPQNCKCYVRDTADKKETIMIYYNGLLQEDFISEKDIMHIDSDTDAEINTYDWDHKSSNMLNCMIQHGDEAYDIEYQCKLKDKDNYYDSCSKAQQDDMLKFIRTFDYHRPDGSDLSTMQKLHHNFGTGGLIVLILTILVFIGVPIAVGIANLAGSSDAYDDTVISSRDLHASMNREREAKGESSIPSINNVQGASSNSLARRDHSWNSVPDFFIKLFRKK